MNYIDGFVYRLVSQLQHWNGMHSVYAFAALLVVYIFILFGRSSMRA